MLRSDSDWEHWLAEGETTASILGAETMLLGS